MDRADSSQHHTATPLQILGEFFLILAWLKETKEREMKRLVSVSLLLFLSLLLKAPDRAELAANYRVVPFPRDMEAAGTPAQPCHSCGDFGTALKHSVMPSPHLSNCVGKADYNTGRQDI